MKREIRIGLEDYLAIVFGEFVNVIFIRSPRGGRIIDLLENHVFHHLYASLDGQTWYLQVVLNRLYEMKETITSDTVDSTIEELVDEQDVAFNSYYESLTDNQAALLSAIAQEKSVSSVTSMEFISNPSLFILDEPDSGLDGVMARELFEHLRQIADTGKIVIVITHTPDRVIDLFDDVIVLAKDSSRTGRLAFYGSIEDARTFFGKQTMEEIVKSINQKEEGGDGLADEFVLKYAEVQNG